MSIVSKREQDKHQKKKTLLLLVITHPRESKYLKCSQECEAMKEMMFLGKAQNNHLHLSPIISDFANKRSVKQFVTKCQHR